MSDLIPITGFLFEKPNQCLEGCVSTVTYFFQGKEVVIHHGDNRMRINVDGYENNAGRRMNELTLAWLCRIHELKKGTN